MDPANAFTVVTPAQIDATSAQLARLSESLMKAHTATHDNASLLRDLRHDHTTQLHNIQLQGLVLAAVLVVTLVVYALSNARRRRESAANLEMVQAITVRMDQQDQRLGAVVDEMAAERVRLQEVVESVRAVGCDLRDDLTTSVTEFQRASYDAQARMASAGDNVTALVVQLQRVAQGLGNVVA